MLGKAVHIVQIAVVSQCRVSNTFVIDAECVHSVQTCSVKWKAVCMRIVHMCSSSRLTVFLSVCMNGEPIVAFNDLEPRPLVLSCGT